MVYWRVAKSLFFLGIEKVKITKSAWCQPIYIEIKTPPGCKYVSMCCGWGFLCYTPWFQRFQIFLLCFIPTDGNENNLFAIDKSSGNLTVVGDLDRETTPTITVLILATSDPECNSTGPYDPSVNRNIKQVDIRLGDINDNGPMFDKTIYTTSKNAWMVILHVSYDFCITIQYNTNTKIVKVFSWRSKQRYGEKRKFVHE